MEPGVPFLLLGVVQMVAVVAWVALGGSALARAGRRPTGPALLVCGGSFLLAVVEVRTALGSGRPSAEDLSWLRAAGFLLVGLGLARGAFGFRRRQPRPEPSGLDAPGALPALTALPALVALPSVVAPLGSSLPPALAAGAAGLAACLATLSARREAVGTSLGLGLLLGGVAALLGPGADSPTVAVAVLAARAVSAAALLVGMSFLARVSLLSKVVTAILTGAVTTGAAAVGVLGTVVIASYDQQSRDAVTATADDRALQLTTLPADQALSTTVLRFSCTPRQPPELCPQVQALLDQPADAVVRVPAAGVPEELNGSAELSAAELEGLREAAAVTAVLGRPLGPSADGPPVTTLVRLGGAAPALAALAVLPEDGRDGQGRPTSAIAYVVRVDDAYATGLSGATRYSLSLLVDGRLAASSGTADEREQVLRAVEELGVGEGLSAAGQTVSASGDRPTLRFLPLPGTGRPVGVLAVALDAEQALRAERTALRALFLAVLAATATVVGVALLLGRRTVDPVRRLTAAAERVSAGDLTVRTAVAGRDEVGVLSRAFDVMTVSLERLTDDLRAAAVRLQAVLTSMSDGLVGTDGAGRVTTVNPAALVMAGLADPAQVLGRPLQEVLTLRDLAGAPLADPGLRLSGVDAVVERPDGSAVPVRVDLRGLDGAAGSVLVLHDTTRDREVERMKTDFLSNVSHELRTPLTPIRGYADLLASRPGLRPEQVSAFAATILSESLKMTRVVDLLVDVAAIEAGRVQVRPRAVPVDELLDPRLAIWRERVPQRAVDLQRGTAGPLPDVLVDPEWLGKALDELLDNAVKYTSAGTTVVLGAAATEGGHVRVFVADRGPGIEESDQRLLFTSFEQVDGSATRRVGGLGLGLSFVSRLAQDAGFPLTVDSVPGRGSEFSLDLPPAEPVRR